MPRHYRDDLERYFDHNCFPPKRLIYLGSINENEHGESGTDFAMADYAIKAITYLDGVSQLPIVIHQNNIGGDWIHGMAIYDAIRAARSHVIMVGWGYVTSMGSVIFQAADTRILAPDACFMIHDGSESFEGHTQNMQRWADYSALASKRMYEVYRLRMKAINPKISTATIKKMCEFDTIFSAEQAVEKGLADWVLEDMDEIGKWFATDSKGTKWSPEQTTQGKHLRREA